MESDIAVRRVRWEPPVGWVGLGMITEVLLDAS
ncbi:hypothetical protein SAMN05443665_103342 [Actinomadura meyerae]|uniref:Uncharacterized protein n=1 Tax=Actinomadura meyerae TaxID=240840 RepID=A0A239MXG5_9ACTN|nr:hypothetical protein SAMN05443665_103342 [Actinomadura meyerae]